MSNWFTKPGSDDREKFAADTSQRSLWRFQLKPGDKARVLFLADEMIGVHEHREQIGKMWEYFTCSRDKNCYFCGMGNKSGYAEYSTALDLTPYTAKDGTQKKYSRRAFRAAGTAIEVLNRKRQLKGQKELRDGKEVFTLTGFIVECFRDGDKSPSCGNDFEVTGDRQDLAKVPPEVNKLIDFEKMLAPVATHIIQAKLSFGGVNVPTTKRSDLQGTASADTGTHSSDDIPF